MYNAFTDEYDLVLLAEYNFELGIRFSENENTMNYLANVYFTLSDNGKWRKVHKAIDSAILNEVNIKRDHQYCGRWNANSSGEGVRKARQAAKQVLDEN